MTEIERRLSKVEAHLGLNSKKSSKESSMKEKSKNEDKMDSDSKK